MKTPKIEQIIILGAGASKCEGAPLQNELLSAFWKSRRQLPSNKLNKIENEIIDFFDSFWGINSKSGHELSFPTFEECLGVLDLAYFREEGFKGGFTRKNILNCRNSLVYLIAKIIEEKLRKPVKYHDALLQRLISEDTLINTAFISLNYDIIIDNSLIKQYNAGYHLDFGVEFINFSRENDWERPDPDKSILLLKPHGSLDWVYCPVCKQLELIPKSKDGAIQAIKEERRCLECKEHMEPVIIPMTFYKQMNNPFIQNVYNRADEILRLAKTIYFCGYSFPDADLHIKYLLKRAELYNNNTPNIYIINEHIKKTELQRSEEEKRYKRFFRNKSSVEYTELSFEQFCKNGIK